MVGAGANITAKFVGNLAHLAEALKTSVAGFHLPDSFDPNVVDLRTSTVTREGPPVVDREDSADPVPVVRKIRPVPR